jgi:ABC-type nitrate/sulfonate/bicarbonate transport system ATPase subunit
MPTCTTDDTHPNGQPYGPAIDGVSTFSPMLTLSGVAFAYGDAGPVFEDYTWQTPRGEMWAILGPSACGKSTLLLLIAGLLRPQAGAISVDGQHLSRPRPRTSLILQEYGLLPWATVRANTELGLRIRRFYGPDGRHAPPGFHLPPTEVEARSNHWLSRLDIAGVADRYPGEISGGQRQRIAIARAMVLAPDLLLMDEPFSALDAPTREGLQRLTLEVCAEAGLTGLLVTHSIEEAVFVGQQILLLGTPPNRAAQVIPNRHASGESYRNSPAYLDACADLRERLRGGAAEEWASARTRSGRASGT